MNFYVNVDDVCTARCPLCKETIILPRQTPLGTFADEPDAAKGVWPITFVCTASIRSCACSAETIRCGQTQSLADSPQRLVLWEILCGCAQEDCLRRHALYTNYREDAKSTEVQDFIAKASIDVPCNGHMLRVSRDKMESQRLDW